MSRAAFPIGIGAGAPSPRPRSLGIGGEASLRDVNFPEGEPTAWPAGRWGAPRSSGAEGKRRVLHSPLGKRNRPLLLASPAQIWLGRGQAKFLVVPSSRSLGQAASASPVRAFNSSTLPFFGKQLRTELVDQPRNISPCQATLVKNS